MISDDLKSMIKSKKRKIGNFPEYTLGTPSPPLEIDQNDLLVFYSQLLRRVPVVLCLGALTGPREKNLTHFRGAVVNVAMVALNPPNCLLATSTQLLTVIIIILTVMMVMIVIMKMIMVSLKELDHPTPPTP